MSGSSGSRRSRQGKLNAGLSQRTLRSRIDDAEREVEQLSEQAAVLARARNKLQARIEADVASLELADFELQAAHARQASLGRQAGKLLHQQLRLLGSMSFLPPAEQWDATIRTHIADMGREQLRYLLLTGYRAYNEWMLAPNAFQNPDTVREMCICANKIKHIQYCFNRNPAMWTSIVNSNLETGEGQVPSSLISNAALALPMHLLPPGFLDYLQEGFRLYDDNVNELIDRRLRLGQRVQQALQLLPQPARTGYACNRGYQQFVHLNPLQALAPAAAPQPFSPASATESEPDVICRLDQDLREYEATIIQEFRARQVFLEYILRKLPLHFLACYVVACQPYHMYLPTTLAAVLRMHKCSQRDSSAQLSKHAEPVVQQRVTTVHSKPKATRVGKQEEAAALHQVQQAPPVQRVVIVPASPPGKGAKSRTARAERGSFSSSSCSFDSEAKSVTAAVGRQQQWQQQQQQQQPQPQQQQQQQQQLLLQQLQQPQWQLPPQHWHLRPQAQSQQQQLSLVHHSLNVVTMDMVPACQAGAGSLQLQRAPNDAFAASQPLYSASRMHPAIAAPQSEPVSGPGSRGCRGLELTVQPSSALSSEPGSVFCGISDSGWRPACSALLPLDPPSGPCSTSSIPEVGLRPAVAMPLPTGSARGLYCSQTACELQVQSSAALPLGPDPASCTIHSQGDGLGTGVLGLQSADAATQPLDLLSDLRSSELSGLSTWLNDDDDDTWLLQYTDL